METRSRLAALVASLAIAVVVTGACSDDGGSGAVTGPTPGSTETGVDVVPGSAQIAIASSAYEPTTLAVASGSTDITITNADAIDHTFTLDDMSVDETVAAGGSATVTVDVSETIGFHCEIHTSMTGTLQVA
jgi:plastocyanin